MADEEKILVEKVGQEKSRTSNVMLVLYLLAFFSLIAIDTFGKKPIPYAVFFEAALLAAALGVKSDRIAELIGAMFGRKG